MPEQELFTLHYITLHYITLHYIIYRYGFTLVFCNLHCIHHTVQITRAQVRYLRQWVEGKTPPAQVTMGETTTCASGVFVPIAEGETPPP